MKRYQKAIDPAMGDLPRGESPPCVCFQCSAHVKQLFRVSLIECIWWLGVGMMIGFVAGGCAP